MSKMLAQKTVEQLRERRELLTQRAEHLKALAEENRFELGLILHQLRIQESKLASDGKN